ncbi:MAG: tail fiber domain-containing protein [bacterium]
MKNFTTLNQIQILLLVLVFSLNTNAQVGIGTSNPTYQLHVVNTTTIGDGNALTVSQNDDNGGVALAGINTDTTNGNLNAAVEGGTNYTGTGGAIVPAVRGLSVGYSGYGMGVIGTTNSPSGYGVYGSSANWALFGNGYNGGFSPWYNVSDRRLKKDIVQLNGALDKLLQLRGVEYNFDKTKYGHFNLDFTNKQIGFIAQEVEEVFPEMIRESEIVAPTRGGKIGETIESSVQTIKTVSYTTLIPVIVESIKEQQQIIESQNNKIEELESRLAKLEKLLLKE